MLLLGHCGQECCYVCGSQSTRQCQSLREMPGCLIDFQHACNSLFQKGLITFCHWFVCPCSTLEWLHDLLVLLLERTSYQAPSSLISCMYSKASRLWSECEVNVNQISECNSDEKTWQITWSDDISFDTTLKQFLPDFLLLCAVAEKFGALLTTRPAGCATTQGRGDTEWGGTGSSDLQLQVSIAWQTSNESTTSLCKTHPFGCCTWPLTYNLCSPCMPQPDFCNLAEADANDKLVSSKALCVILITAGSPSFDFDTAAFGHIHTLQFCSRSI